MIQLVDADEYGIVEGFVYDYLTYEWYRYKKGDGGLTESSSYSGVLAMDLNQFL